MKFLLALIFTINAYASSDVMVNAQSMGASFNGTAKQLVVTGFSIQSVYSGTPSGTLKLQGSNDGTNYDDVPSASSALTGSAGSSLWNLSNIYFKYIRVVWTRTGGTGSVTSSYFDNKGE